MAKFAAPTWVIHMATCRPAHNTPIHMDLGKKNLKEPLFSNMLVPSALADADDALNTPL